MEPLKISMKGTDLPKKAQEEFEPSKYAKKKCRNCNGKGWIRVHVNVKGKVVPKDNNIEHKPCDCAISRYKKKLLNDKLAGAWVR